MAKQLPLVIAIVVMLLTAGVGFLTKSKVTTVQGNLSKTRSDLTTTRGSLDRKTSELKKTTEDLTAANKTVEDQKEQLTTATQERDTAKKAAEDATGQLADRDKQIADLKKEKEDLVTKIGGPGNGEDLTAKVAQMQAQLSANQTALAEKEKLVDDLTTKSKTEQSQLQTANSELRRYRDNIAVHGITGRIQAVNPGWNFVVINVGDRQGATVNSQLVVVRNGQNIGRVKITSVEPSSSIADVIPGSMAKGQRVQPGDEVVFTGNRGTVQSQSAPAGNNLPSGGAPPAPVVTQQ